MLLRDFLPHPALREFVQCYRICHFEFGNIADIPFKAWAPKPENILHFFLRDFWAIQRAGEKKITQPAVVLVGQRTALVHQFTGSTFLNVQIVFQPSGLFRITSIPAFELADRHIDAALIFNNEIRTTFDKLQHAKGYDELIQVIEQFGCSLVRHGRNQKVSIDTVSQQMIQRGGKDSLDKLADDASLGTKQFQRKFYERVGVNPKTYSRIIRMTRAYNLRNAYPNRDWLDIAIACGYYDYQHLVKDYKDFTGLTPTEFLAFEARTPERILGLTNQLYKDRASAFEHA